MLDYAINLNDSSWHMITATRAASGNNFVLYVDGSSVTSGTLGSPYSNKKTTATL